MLKILHLTETAGKQIMAAYTGITMNGCSGKIGGLGTLIGHELAFSPFNDDNLESNKKCSLKVLFSEDFNKVTIESEGNCMDYSGASCGWEGKHQLIKIIQ